jgi:hypothetical protein
MNEPIEPGMLWLKQVHPTRRWPVGGPVFLALFGLQCLARIYLAAKSRGDFLAVLCVETMLDPLMYLWGFLASRGMDTVTEPLRYKCPHCGKAWAASEEVVKSPIGTRYSCINCKNVFRKLSPPA